MRHLGNACIIWIPSLLSVTVGCYSSRQPSAADTNTSWLDSCAQQSDCTAGYACIAGFCQSDDGTLGTAGTNENRAETRDLKDLEEFIVSSKKNNSF